MSGFEDDSFNASGRRHGRNKKTIQIVKKAALAGTPVGITAQMADAASKGKISEQVKETWNIDGFDNASGEKKKLTSTQGAMIGFAALLITGVLIYAIKHMGKKPSKG